MNFNSNTALCYSNLTKTADWFYINLFPSDQCKAFSAVYSYRNAAHTYSKQPLTCTACTVSVHTKKLDGNKEKTIKLATKKNYEKQHYQFLTYISLTETSIAVKIHLQKNCFQMISSYNIILLPFTNFGGLLLQDSTLNTALILCFENWTGIPNFCCTHLTVHPVGPWAGPDPVHEVIECREQPLQVSHRHWEHRHGSAQVMQDVISLLTLFCSGQPILLHLHPWSVLDSRPAASWLLHAPPLASHNTSHCPEAETWRAKSSPFHFSKSSPNAMLYFISLWQCKCWCIDQYIGHTAGERRPENFLSEYVTSQGWGELKTEWLEITGRPISAEQPLSPHHFSDRNKHLKKKTITQAQKHNNH